MWIPQPGYRYTGAGRPVQPNVPRGTTAKRKYTKAVSALIWEKRAWREGQSRCSQVSAGAGSKKKMEHGLTQRLDHPSFGRAKLESYFVDGQLFVKVRCQTGPSITVHADFFLSRACPSMPCDNVIKTATKLVTDNVANTTGYYQVNDILCVLQWTFVWLWQASLGNW